MYSTSEGGGSGGGSGGGGGGGSGGGGGLSPTGALPPPPPPQPGVTARARHSATLLAKSRHLFETARSIDPACPRECYWRGGTPRPAIMTCWGLQRFNARRVNRLTGFRGHFPINRRVAGGPGGGRRTRILPVIRGSADRFRDSGSDSKRCADGRCTSSG